MDQWTANMGLGFMVNDALTIGMSQVPAATATDDDSYDMWLRYNLSMMDGAYAVLQMPTENGSDNMEVGLGFAFNIWNGLYIEPNVMMDTSGDDKETNFNFGLSYRF